MYVMKWTFPLMGLDQFQDRIVGIHDISTDNGVPANDRNDISRVPALQQAALKKTVVINPAGTVFFIIKITGPFTFLFPCLDDFPGDLFYTICERIVGEFTPPDGNEMLVPCVAGKEDFFVFMMQNRAAFQTTCPAADAGSDIP
jgi:hypothetical protein